MRHGEWRVDPVRTEITNPLQEILKRLAHMKHGWTFQQTMCLSIDSSAVQTGLVNKRIIRSACSPGHKAANDIVRQVQLGAVRKLVKHSAHEPWAWTHRLL